MSVASEFDIQRQLITNAYNKLDDLGIDSTGVDKNIDNIAEMLDTVYEEYPKVQGTGTEITLNGTKVGKLSLDVKGNSTQDGTPTPTNEVPILSAGDDINLFDYENAIAKTGYAKNASGTEISTGSGNYTTSFTEVLPNTTYTLSADLTSAIIRFYFYDANKNWISRSDGYTVSSSNNVYIFTTPNNCYYIQFQNVKNYARNDKAKLEKGNVATSYSPYGMGSISEKIVNKNLFDGQNPVYVNGKILNDSGTEINDASGGYTKMYIPVKSNTTYTVSGLSSSGSKRIYYFDKNKTFISRTGTIAQSYNTFTTPANCYYIDIQYYITGNDFTTYQLELSSTATDFVAHAEQTYTIPCQQPMRSIGTVRDEFIKVNGNWFERHNIGQKILNGTETVNYYSVTQGSLFRVSIAKSISDTIPYSNYYKGLINGVSRTNNTFYYNKAASTLQDKFDFVDNRYTNAQDFSNWIATQYTNGNPVYIDYILETPQDLPCTAEQIAILENLPKSYNEQTNIYSLDVTPAYFDASALKSE